MTGQQPQPESTAALPALTDAGREKRWVALTSVGAAVVLTAMKLILGLLTGSLGLLAEAAHSGLDLAAAVITYFAVRVSDRPADAEHPYGHGKAENVSAFAETVLLLVACFWIMSEAVERLFFKHVPVEVNVWSFVVIVISIVIDLTRSRALRRVAEKHHSQALEADALHFSTDVWSSAVVLLGLGLVKLGDWIGQVEVFERADAVAALIVALIVVLVSYRLGRRTIDMLLDRAPVGMLATIAHIVRQVDGVVECRQVRTRQAGQQSFVDLTIGVRRGQSLEGSHAIGTRVEERIRALYPQADVIVHIDPVGGNDETLPEQVRAIAAQRGQTVHNVQFTQADGQLHVELHLETNERLDLRLAHEQAEGLEAAIAAELPAVAKVTTHIEPERERAQAARDVTATSAPLVRSVERIAAETPGVVGCHDVTVRQAGRDTYLALHCTFASGLSVRDVHELSSKLEQRLRAAIPNLARVTTHAEPSEGNAPLAEGQ
jgi:cation diffusion facilitator family transporter